MERNVAEAVVAWGRGVTKMDTVTARGILEQWLRARGMTTDAWGNFHPAGPDEKGRVYRYKFSKLVLHKQRHHAAQGWSNVENWELIPTAVNVLANAAREVGETALVERMEKLKTKRMEKKSADAFKKKVEAQERLAVDLATKEVGRKFREVMLQAAKNAGGERANADDVSADDKSSMDMHFAVVQDGYNEALAKGEPVPTDADFASADRPPVPPFLYNMRYFWVEDGYSISVQGGDMRAEGARGGHRRMLFVRIGKNVASLFFDPFKGAIKMDFSQDEPVGHGHLEAEVFIRANGTVEADVLRFGVKDLGDRALELAEAKRALQLWLRMARGWGVKEWTMLKTNDRGLSLMRQVWTPHREDRHYVYFSV